MVHYPSCLIEPDTQGVSADDPVFQTGADRPRPTSADAYVP